MEHIINGVRKFQREVFPKTRHIFEQLATSQNPEVLFITCADSRIVPSLITQTGPGDLFLCRNAGNMVPPYGELLGGVSATIEYAVCVLRVKDIIVCGHSDCGAMKGVLNPDAVKELPTVKSWLAHGELARRIVLENYPGVSGKEALEILTEENVIAQMEHLRTHPSVAASCVRGELRIHGWVYHIHSGRVDAWDESSSSFVPVEDATPIRSPVRGRLRPVLERKVG
ncbi:MAG: carbonic anhydrase [Bryobacteraceae bacterium]|nr:carbonic anhydrase [Bryobacteraceae bacterium]